MNVLIINNGIKEMLDIREHLHLEGIRTYYCNNYCEGMSAIEYADMQGESYSAILLAVSEASCRAMDIIDEILIRDMRIPVLPFTRQLSRDIVSELKQRNCNLFFYRGMNPESLCQCIEKILYTRTKIA